MVPKAAAPGARQYVSESISSVGIRGVRGGSIGSMGPEVNEMRNSDGTPTPVYVRGLHILQNLEQAIRRTPHARRPTNSTLRIGPH